MRSNMRKFECFECRWKWDEPYGTGRPTSCPSCGSSNIHRASEDRGGGRGFRAGCPGAPMRGQGGRRYA